MLIRSGLLDFQTTEYISFGKAEEGASSLESDFAEKKLPEGSSLHLFGSSWETHLNVSSSSKRELSSLISASFKRILEEIIKTKCHSKIRGNWRLRRESPNQLSFQKELLLPFPILKEANFSTFFQSFEILCHGILKLEFILLDVCHSNSQTYPNHDTDNYLFPERVWFKHESPTSFGQKCCISLFETA